MGDSLIVVTSLGFVTAQSVLVATLRAGRRDAVRRVPWIIALVLIGISLVFRLAIIVGTSLAASYSAAVPIAVGELAVAAVFAVAFLRPAWGGWLLIGTALALPAVSALLDLAGDAMEQSYAVAILGFYSIPATVSGALLLWAGDWRPRRMHASS